MDELISRVKAALKRYGIESDEELMQAIDRQKRVDIGIFFMDYRVEDNNVEKAS